MKKKLFLRTAPVLVVASLFAAACSSDEPDAPEDTTAVPTVQFLYPNQAYDPVRTEIGQLMTKEWEDLGLTVEGSPMDFDAMSARLDSQPDSYQAFIYSFAGNPERIDPDLILRQAFACGDNGSNYFGYCNKDYDKLLLESSTEIDQAARQQQIYQAQEILQSDLPAATIYHLETLSAWNSAKFEAPTPYRSEGAWFWWPGEMVPLTDDKVLKIGQTFDFGSENPFVDTGGGNVEYFKLIYDTLTRVTPEGETVPWAAESFDWKDPTTLEVKLRPGMTFSDGTPVTSKDVAFSYELFQKGEGFAAEVQPFLEPIDSIDTPDDQTVVFNLKTAYAPFPTVAMSQIYILPEHIWADQTGDLLTFKNDPPVGSGQFTFDYWKKNQEVSLKANPSHFSPPKVDGLLGVTYGTPDAVFQALSKQEIDIHQASLQASEYNDLAEEDFMTVGTSDDIGVYYVGFNLRQPPFDDPQFRLALTYAIPYQQIVDTLFEGFATTGSGFIAPANKIWHDPDLVPYTYDPDKAKQILEDAGYQIVDGKLYMPDTGGTETTSTG